MKELTIGEVAQQTGFQPSALRYYESVGLIQPSGRVRRQRRYHPDILNRLAVIKAAQQVGFSVALISKLLSGFEGSQSQPGRWESLAHQKIIELDLLITQAQQMKQMLTRLLQCECVDLNQCGQTLIEQKQAILGSDDTSLAAGDNNFAPINK
jgi:MerR family transcriptional regulator, redox-sensitive transcriptional activator SoxR